MVILFHLYSFYENVKHMIKYLILQIYQLFNAFSAISRKDEIKISFHLNWITSNIYNEKVFTADERDSAVSSIQEYF
jgi:hypothetical protein